MVVKHQYSIFAKEPDSVEDELVQSVIDQAKAERQEIQEL